MTTSPVMSVNDELVAELEALASKATGGEWEYHIGLIRTMPDSDGYVPIAVAPNAPKNWRGQRDTNMHYIATSNPATILALLAERAELKRDAERYRWLRDPCSGAERVVTYGRGDYGRGLMSYTMLDAAIDAAMQSEAKP